MGFWQDMKKIRQEQKEIDKTLTAITTCEVDRGENHIFTKRFTMGKTEDGYALINRKYKVKIISCSEYHETETFIQKSASKKIAGAVVGSALGAAGAIVGAVAVGNNKKKKITHHYDKLVVVDENGYTHEIILKSSIMQRKMINMVYFK